MAIIKIPDSAFEQIMTIMGFPFITIADAGEDVNQFDLELNKEQIITYIIQPALYEYYRWFPVETYQTVSINGNFEIPFPDNKVFGVKDVRNAIPYNTNLTGNAFFDSRIVTRNPRQMYGTRNDYGFSHTAIMREFEVKSNYDTRKAFKWRAIEQQRVLKGFSNVGTTVEITWASVSDEWDDIAFSQLGDVVKFCKGKVLEFFGTLRLQNEVPDAPVELNGQALLDRGDDLIDSVYEKWKNFTVPIIQRG